MKSQNNKSSLDWRTNAIAMSNEGWSWRKISELLKVPKSTVSDFLRKQSPRPESKHSVPRILLIDIETAPIIGAVWQLWNNNVGLNQIVSDWHVLSFCAKWYGDDEIFYKDQRGAKNIENDKDILGTLHSLMDESDFIIGHNVRKFDNRKINARFILNGFRRPSPYRMIDTYEIARQEFGFTSNRLEYLADKLGTKKKSKHSKYPGYQLWAECLKGNIDAFQEMEEYNKMDVIVLEEIFEILAPWYSKLPNLDIYKLDVYNPDEWVPDGFHYTNVSKFQRYRNVITGQYKRGRTNLLDKHERKKIIMSI